VEKMLSRKLGVTVAGIFTGVGLTLLAAIPGFSYLQEHIPAILAGMGTVIVAYLGVQGWIDRNGK